MSDFFVQLTQNSATFIGYLKEMFSTIWSIFYTAGEGGGWTDLGKFVLIAVSIAFVYSGLRFVMRLIHLRG